MKKKLLSGSLGLMCLLAACQPGEQSGDKSEVTMKEAPAVTDTMIAPAPGSDKDKHGCIPSAGYTWSALRNNCVRLFEEKGVKLDPVDNKESYVAVATVLFDDANTKAEVFLPSEGEGIILERKTPGDSTHWQGNDLELIREKKYVVKKAGVKIFQEP